MAREEPTKVEPPRGRPPELTENPPEIDFRKTLPGPKPTVRIPKPDRRTEPPAAEAIGNFVAPVIKYPPQYPEGCRSRGLEGDVIVQFDVTPEGSVVNVVIVQSPHTCFNGAVRRTVAKWKYPPAAKNGRPGMRYGVVERFQFVLTE